MRSVKIFLLGWFSLLILVLNACDDKVDGNMEITPLPMLYSLDFTLGALNSDSNDPSVITKGIDYEWSFFTDEYPYSYIYIHSADSDSKNHRSLKIPVVDDVEACDDDCKGIRFQIDVHDGGSYTIQTSEGSIEMGKDENVYFSTLNSPLWTANESGKTFPLDETIDLFERDSDKNVEILRSTKEYTVNDLLNLAADTNPVIDLSRHCTGFRTRMIFTQINEDGEYDVGASEFKRVVGYPYTNFFIKLYVGPAFCHKYDIYNNSVPVDDNGGYYISRESQYVQFTAATFRDSGETESYDFDGFGYQTELEDILVSPLNLNITDNQPFKIYAFVKFAEDLDNLPDDFYTSDNGAFWFETDMAGMSTDPNYIYRCVLVYNIDELKKVADWTLGTETFPESETNTFVTRSVVSSLRSRRIDVLPLKTFYEPDNN